MSQAVQFARNFFRNKGPIFYYLFLLLLFMATYFIFIYEKGFLLFGDFNPAVSKAQFLYAWSSKNLGYDYSSYLSPLFYWVISFWFTKIFSLNIGTQLTFIIPIIYFISAIFWSVYKIFKISPYQAFFIGLFSLFNPVTLGYIYHGGVDITFIGFTNIYLSFIFLYKFIQQPNFDLKTLIISVLFSSFTVSPVYFFVYWTLLFAYLFFELVLSQQSRRKILLKFVLFSAFFGLVNSYWLLPFANSLLFHDSVGLVFSNNGGVSILNSLKPFSTLIDVLSFYYFGALQERLHFGPFLDIVMLMFFGWVIYFLLIKKPGFLVNRSSKGKIILLVLILFVFSLFFATGPNPPFGLIFTGLFKIVPFFQGFRTYIRFCVVLFICFLLLLAFLYEKFQSDRRERYTISAVIILLCAYFGFHFIYLKTNNIHPLALPSEYIEHTNYPSLSDSLTLDSPIFTYNQGHTWGDSSIISYLSDRYFWYGYTGYLESNDIKRLLVDAYNNNSYDKDLIIRLNSILNIENIISHKDKYSDNKTISLRAKEILDRLEKEGVIYKKTEAPSFDLFKVNESLVLPHVYIPNKIKVFDRSIKSLSAPLNDKSLDYGSAFYLSSQNKDLQNNIEQVQPLNEKTTIEYKKINPSKYRIILHNADGRIPIIFSESYHTGWKLYQSDKVYEKSSVSANDLNNYKIFLANEASQATKGEVEDFIENGLVSTLGDGKEKTINHSLNVDGILREGGESARYKTGFISKNRFNTIQNDNLPNGSLLETDSLSAIQDSSHFVANGYSNGWVIDVSTICSNKNSCYRNEDGSYNIELIAEFSPQKLYFLGIAVTSVLIISSFAYLVISKNKGT